MRIGVFGGSFDPVHYGHLLLAECCREQCQLDEVRFVPAAVPPHKQQRDLAPAKHRIEMLKLAIAGHESFVISTLEIDRGGVSYTADTLKSMSDEHPGVQLFLLMGAESLRDLPTWYDPQRICRLAVPTVVRRAGGPELDFDVLREFTPTERLEQIKNHQVEMPLIELSSTEIRNLVREGRSIRYRTPRAVEKYIETHELYR